MLVPMVMVLIPLAIAPGVLFYYDVTPKVTILLLGTTAALIWSWPKDSLNRHTGRWFGILVLAQTVSLGLSTLLSTRPELSMVGTRWRRYGLITQLAILLFAWVAAACPPEKIVRAIAFSGIPVACYGILQYFGWDPFLPAQSYHVGEGIWTIVRPPATLGHASYFANYLLYVVFAGVALLMTGNRAAGSLAATAGVVGIVLSGTRAAMLGLAAGAIFLWLVRRPRVRWRLVVAGLGLMAIFYFSPAGQKLRSRTRWFMEDPRGGARLWLWRDSLNLAARHWLAGAGPETFSVEFPKYQSVELSRAYPDFYHESAHNIFLDALTAQGVAGLAVLLVLIVVALRSAFERKTPLNSALGAGLAGAVVSQQFTVFTAPTAVCFFVTVGVLCGAPFRRPPKAVPALLLLPFVLMAIWLLSADYRLERVKKALDRGNIREAIAIYEPTLKADLWYSRKLAVAAQSSPEILVRMRGAQQAFEAAQRAVLTAEDPQNAWYNLAALDAARNDFPHTEESLRRAVVASPNWFKPHWLLAQVLASGGRIDEARREAAIAVDLNGGKNPEVEQTLKRLEK